MQLKQFYDIATKVSSRKKCYYFWWSPWLLIYSRETEMSFFIIRICEYAIKSATGNSSFVNWVYLSYCIGQMPPGHRTVLILGKTQNGITHGVVVKLLGAAFIVAAK